MNKIWAVAKREYNASVRTKAFLVSLIAMPLLMCSGWIAQMIFKKLDDRGDLKVAIIDRTKGQVIYPSIEEAVKRYNAQEVYDSKTKARIAPTFAIQKIAPSENTPEAIRKQRLELSDLVRTDKLDGFLEIGANVLTPDISILTKEKHLVPDDKIVRYQSPIGKEGDFRRWVRTAINRAIYKARCDLMGLPVQKVEVALLPVPVVDRDLTKAEEKSEKADDDQPNMIPFFVGFVSMMLMFMMNFIGAIPLMQGIVEEKSNRISEVLLGSLRPFELMMGKLLGIVAVGLTLSTIYIIGALIGAQQFGYLEYLPMRVLGWFLVFQMVGTFMYGSMFISVGAAAADSRETQTLQMPIMMFAMLPLMMFQAVIKSPNGMIAQVLTFFPPATPMVVVFRQSISPNIPIIQPILALVVSIAFIVVCVYAAGRIFRVGILMQGKGANYRDMLRWVIKG